MFGLLVRALSWAGTIALGWVGADWFNERQTTKQQVPDATEGAIVQKTFRTHWIKWAAGGVGLAVGFLLLNKLFEKK